ncbi:MAG TPA: hypothetical protein VJL34_09495 [Anaerolineales bacterium]|nr:hypothetical protein [Anaerolineales bacterium]
MLSLPTGGAPFWKVSAQQPEGTETPSSTPEHSPTAAAPRATVTPIFTARPQVAISEPLPGQALQGKYPILGTSAVAGFQSSELAFSYANVTTDTWFLIFTSSEPVTAGLLAEWDTTQISDGDYDVRLIVDLVDGAQISTVVPGVRVRNYTPIETSTPTPLTPTSAAETTEVIAGTPTNSPQPLTPTPFPPNPAQVSNQDLASSFAQGALFMVGAFALGGLYIAIRNLRSNR